MSAHQSGGSLIMIICFILMSGEVKTQTDPCIVHTVLDEPWRATNYSNPVNWKCDVYTTWVGWYRLMYQGLDIRMPESCINIYMCGTHAPLWLNGPHPLRQDGVVTRQVCGNWAGNCCYFKSYPIRVKACPGNFYVYEFVRPNTCVLGYCADIATVKPPAHKIKHLAITMRLSSEEDLEQLDTTEVFLEQVKEDLTRKGFPFNITLHLKSISKLNDLKPEPGTC